MTVDAVKKALGKIRDLPRSAESWRIETGPDATGSEAVWVWVTLKEHKLDYETRASIRTRVQEAVRRAARGSEPWVYVRFRAAHEVVPD